MSQTVEIISGYTNLTSCIFNDVYGVNICDGSDNVVLHRHSLPTTIIKPLRDIKYVKVDGIQIYPKVPKSAYYICDEEKELIEKHGWGRVGKRGGFLSYARTNFNSPTQSIVISNTGVKVIDESDLFIEGSVMKLVVKIYDHIKKTQ